MWRKMCPRQVRLDGVSFSVHSEVAGLARPQQREWLARAKERATRRTRRSAPKATGARSGWPWQGKTGYRAGTPFIAASHLRGSRHRQDNRGCRAATRIAAIDHPAGNCRPLSFAVSVDQVKLLMDVAAAQEVFAKRQNLGEVVIGFAYALKFHALEKLAELLKALPKATGSRGQARGRDISGGTKLVPPENSAPSFADLGVDKKTAAIARQLIALPAATREAIAQREDTLAHARRRQKGDALEQDVNIEKARGGDAPQRARRADCLAGAIRREPHPCGRSDDTPHAVGLSVSRRHGELRAFQDWGSGWWLA